MISRQLKAAILASGMSPNEIARRAGVPQPSLSYFLRDVRGLSLDTADKVASVLNLILVQQIDIPSGGQ